MGSCLDRVLAVACEKCRRKPGTFCLGGAMVCASRIQAAEEAAKPTRKGVRAHAYGGDFVPRGTRGPDGRGVYSCHRCATWMSYIGKKTVYSRDSGATWTPGPDACPGRPSGTEQGER